MSQTAPYADQSQWKEIINNSAWTLPRIANDFEINYKSLIRWINQDVTPRPNNYKRMETVLKKVDTGARQSA